MVHEPGRSLFDINHQPSTINHQPSTLAALCDRLHTFGRCGLVGIAGLGGAKMTMPQEAQIETLVRDNIGLIRSLVAKTMRTFAQLPSGYDRDDLESLGYIGLIQAAQTY